jgi:hypothetical protein
VSVSPCGRISAAWAWLRSIGRLPSPLRPQARKGSSPLALDDTASNVMRYERAPSGSTGGPTFLLDIRIVKEPSARGRGDDSHCMVEHSNDPSLRRTGFWSDSKLHFKPQCASTGRSSKSGATVMLTTSCSFASNVISSSESGPTFPGRVWPHTMDSVLAASTRGAHARSNRRVRRSGSRPRSFERKELTRYLAPTQLQARSDREVYGACVAAVKPRSWQALAHGHA